MLKTKSATKVNRQQCKSRVKVQFPCDPLHHLIKDDKGHSLRTYLWLHFTEEVKTLSASRERRSEIWIGIRVWGTGDLTGRDDGTP